MLILRLWKSQPGKFFCLSTKDHAKKWEDHFFSRKELKNVRPFINKNKDKDLYFCPHGFSRRRRLKQFAEAPRLLYADLDEVNPNKIDLKPTIALESSPGRFVGFWVVDRVISEDINRRLTYLLGADKGGWDLTQVLRVPGTYNYKYKSTPKVRIRWMDGPEYKLKTIMSQLPKGEDRPGSEGSGDIAYQIFQKHEKNLSVFARREILRGRPKRGKRSEVFWRLVQEVIESGLSTDEAFELLRVSPWNKFAGRRNEEQQIKREIQKALKQHLPDRPKPEERPIEPDEGKEDEPYKFLSLSLADVEPEVINWLWYPYIAKGELTILEGDPGLGKSYLAQIVAMSIADGKSLPSVKRLRPVCGRIAYFDIENSSGTVTKRRLIDNGCKNFKNFFQEEEAFSIRDEDDLDEVYEAIDELRPLLVVFDTVNTYMGKTDTHNASDTQQAFARFRDIAKRFDCAVLVLRHLTKSSKERALYRGQGSISFAGLARVIMTVGTMPDEPDTKVMAVTKINVTKPPRAITFTIDSLPDTLKFQDRSRFSWGDWVDISSDEIVIHKPVEGKNADTLKDARDFLWEVLDDGGLEARQIKKAAEARSISMRTVYRAASELGIIKKSTGFGKKKRVLWILPESAKDPKDCECPSDATGDKVAN